MTNEKSKKMLKAKLECLKRETSGTDIDCNYRNCDECNLCYEQGNMGEQKEALEIAIKALEQQPILDTRQRERQLEMEYQHGYDKGWEEGRKALEQQPCEDCISRQAVLDKKELVELEDGQSFYCINPEDVETLPPATPQPCEDCVSREALKEKKVYSEERHENVVPVAEIDWLPSVKPQPKTGHWSRKTKVDAYDIGGVKTWGIKCQCDRCCFTTIVVEDFGYYKYCPNCGVEMEGDNGE